MTSLTNPGPHLFWITSRAAGDAALVLSSVSAGLGLLMVTRELKARGPDLRVVHETLSLATIVAIAVHGIALVGDKFAHPSLANVLIPFSWSYKSGWTTLGILAGWALVLLGPTYYVRRWIGAARWRSLHRLAALAWIAGLVHSVGEGTDAGQTWFIAMTCTVAIPVGLLLLGRLTRGATGSPAPVTPSRHRSAADARSRRAASVTVGARPAQHEIVERRLK